MSFLTLSPHVQDASQLLTWAAARGWPELRAPHQRYLARYAPQREKSRPGYYAVTLDDYGIRAELTSTERVDMRHYTFPRNGQLARVIIDLQEGIDDKAADAYLEQVDAQTFISHRFSQGWAKN